MSDRMTRPFDKAALHCTFTVSAQLIRSDMSSSRQPISDTLDTPERIDDPQRLAAPQPHVAYQPGGTASLLITASGAIGAPSRAVRPGKAFGVAPCPAARSSS